jgi:glutamyl-tRNA synthetase
LGFPVFPTNWTTAEGEVFSGYREKGYYPESFINMLAFLGWNPGTTQELFSLEELSEAFTLDRVSKAGAKFDPDKTKWFQQQHLRLRDNAVLAADLKTIVEGDHSLEKLSTICGLMKERATFIQDILTEGGYLLDKPTSYDEKTVHKKWKEHSPALMQEWLLEIKSIATFNAETIESTFKAFLEAREMGIGAVLPLFRLLVTGNGMGPSMFEIAEFLGKEECIERITTGISEVSTVSSNA